MRTADVLNRWLVIATDSKQGPTDEGWTKWATERQKQILSTHPPLGEKGIGRLAVSTLGRGVAVWTRWGNPESPESTLLFVHWDIFRHPGLSLEKISIPYKTITGRAPTTEDVDSLFKQASRWLAKSKELWQSERESQLFESISLDLEEVFPRCLADMDLKSTVGTTFLVFGTTEEVEELFKAEVIAKEEIRVSEGLKLLLGFSDPFSGNHKRIDPEFLIDGKVPAAGQNFWTEDDFAVADHEIALEVNADGFARGSIRRFGKTIPYSIQVPLGDRMAAPGPFSIHVGYIEGEPASSRLQAEIHNSYSTRLKGFGALYVYRDGIRVLPYGRADHDFLGFEERRSLNAGRYFFSHRRMFGAVYLGSRENPELRDKAGREGLIKNGAYRGFTEILRGIFIDLALSHFGSESDRQDKGQSPKEKSGVEAVRAKAKAERDSFLEELEGWIKRLTSAQSELATRIATSKTLVASLKCREDVEKARQSVEKFHDCREEILDQLGVALPPAVQLSRAQREFFDAYLTTRHNLEIDSLKAESNLREHLSKAASGFTSQRERAAELQRLLVHSESSVLAALRSSSANFRNAAAQIAGATAQVWEENHVLAIRNEVERLIKGKNADEIEADSELRKQAYRAIAEQRRLLREVILPFWRRASKQIEKIAENPGVENQLGTLNRAIEESESRAQNFSELAQLGLIVESLDHEFNILFSGMKSDIRRLAGKIDPSAADILAHFNLGFESLEGKLRFLSPLYRRRWGNKEELTGTEIRTFIEKLYSGNRRGDTTIEFSEKFIALRLVKVNKPVLLAGVANLVSNGIYWAGRSKTKATVRFTAVPNGFAVSDSGPGVSPRDRERVFEPFFGRRPSGRGLGLYITRTNFAMNNLSIVVAEENPRGALPGACFLITHSGADDN